VGLILDSSVVIAAERRRDTVEKLIEHVISVTGDQEAALSSVGLTELAHGIYRAQTPETRLRRQSFIDALLRVLTVYPYTKETALLGAKIDPFGDLLVGVTALELGFPVLTINVRHFRLIPGLQIVQLSETVSGPVVASNKMDKVRK
jgi:predicted nucleic acid-binding protein